MVGCYKLDFNLIRGIFCAVLINPFTLVTSHLGNYSLIFLGNYITIPIPTAQKFNFVQQIYIFSLSTAQYFKIHLISNETLRLEYNFVNYSTD